MFLGLTQNLMTPRAVQAFRGPLDDYTSNLQLMLLPFRGLSSYTGSLFRVRDTSNDQEQDVGYNSTGSLVAPTVSGSAAVRWWYDQSGNALHTGQSVASVQPLLLANAIGSLHGCDFDGTDDFIDTSSSLNFASGCSLYFVVKWDVDNAWQSIWTKSTANTSRIRKRAGAPGINSLDLTYNPGQTLVGTNSVGTSSRLVTAVIGSTDARIWVNNTLEATGVAGNMDSTVYRIGIQSDSLFPANAKISALLAYNAVHNTTTRQGIQTILANQFGITLA